MSEDSNAWANRLFDGIEVSDGRLKNRLIKTVQFMSNNPGIPINRTDGGGAKIEGHPPMSQYLSVDNFIIRTDK